MLATPTSKTRVTLIDGATGGIMPASRHRVAIWNFNPLSIQLYKKKDSDYFRCTNYFAFEADEVSLQHMSSELDPQEFVWNLLAIFKNLPIEDPVGSWDIYSSNISICIESDGFRWQNTTPTGCGRTFSTTLPSAAQKEMFRSYAEKCFALAEKYAMRATNEESEYGLFSRLHSGDRQVSVPRTRRVVGVTTEEEEEDGAFAVDEMLPPYAV